MSDFLLCSKVSQPQLISAERVRAVIANPDPVTRNFEITQSYHELTRELDPHFGGVDLVWCAFATYASKQAGRFIRNEEVPPLLRRFLGLDVRRRGWRGLLRLLTPSGLLRQSRFLEFTRLTVADVARSVAEGNHLVYAKLAPLYAGFLALLNDTGDGEPAAIDAFLAGIEADPTSGGALRRAFAQYHAARFEDDPKLRAERIFLANALVGWHEQIRLQEAIDGALREPVRRAFEDPDRRLFTFPLPGFVRRLGTKIFRSLFATAIRRFEDDWAEVATRCLMTLGYPGGSMDLSEDLPPLADGRMFPEALAEITLPELHEVLAELDATPDTTRGSGAHDWTRLGDRMNYIVDFFRSRQQDRTLLIPPFPPEQVAAIQRRVRVVAEG